MGAQQRAAAQWGGSALPKRAAGRLGIGRADRADEAPAGTAKVPEPDPVGTLYRVTVFDKPRGPWRKSHDDALQDAIEMHLTAYDQARREHYCAVPTDIEVRFPPDKPKAR